MGWEDHQNFEIQDDRAAVVAVQKAPQVQIEATVLRAVPCQQHDVYHLGCPLCLTGEQAQLLGVEQKIERRGVVARSPEEGVSFMQRLRRKVK